MEISGKKKALCLLILNLYCGLSIAEAPEPMIPMFGPGLYKCSNYVDERLTEQDKKVFDSWITGFVTSLAIYNSRRVNFEKEITPMFDDVALRCRVEPEIFFAEAVSESFSEWIKPVDPDEPVKLD
jgi:hypothetical protein